MICTDISINGLAPFCINYDMREKIIESYTGRERKT